MVLYGITDGCVRLTATTLPDPPFLFRRKNEYPKPAKTTTCGPGRNLTTSDAVPLAILQTIVSAVNPVYKIIPPTQNPLEFRRCGIFAKRCSEFPVPELEYSR